MAITAEESLALLGVKPVQLPLDPDYILPQPENYKGRWGIWTIHMCEPWPLRPKVLHGLRIPFTFDYRYYYTICGPHDYVLDLLRYLERARRSTTPATQEAQ